MLSLSRLALAAIVGLALGATVPAGEAWAAKTATHAPHAANNDPATIHQEGEASWYGTSRKHRMRKTSSGERFNPAEMTAAHATLPLQSTITVTNLENGRTVVVRINDRLPLHRKRIIDVTPKAAEALGFKHTGVTRVALGPASSPPPPRDHPSPN